MLVQKQRRRGEVFWPKVVLKKWLNLRSKDSEFAADEDDDGSDIDDQENCGCNDGDARRPVDDGAQITDESLESAPYKLRRRNSETLRAQYINTKELRICAGTWNAGGKAPPDDLDIAEWLGTRGEGEPADIYVLGFQEVVPLNAGNVFGAEDGRPALAWESLIRGALRRTQPSKPKYKCYSHPPSPSRFDPSGDAADAADELLPGTDTETDTDDDAPFPVRPEHYVAATPRKLSRLNHFSVMDGSEHDHDELDQQQQWGAQQRTLLRTLSRADRVGLVWPEQPLDLLATRTLNTASSLSSASFKASRSFSAYKSFRGLSTSRIADVPMDDLAMIPDLDLDLDGALRKKSRSPLVRIASKQMVGIFLTIWVRRGLRKCVQNLKVSTVGVGAMGYIGNKGAVSVSMSIYQTMFCFVCTHLAAGEKPGDVQKRNADVQEIHRRTRFAAPGDLQLPRDIYDHERIFWLGDLNYRLDVSYEKAHELISAMDWSQLAEKDQLKRELKKGRAFDGWTEGIIEFAPTYKYELNSGKYIGDDQKGGRRTPAWCDRILSFGKGVRLLSYRRSELTLSDHRPVMATYAAEVEVFISRKLQRALTLTDAEVEGGQVVPDLDF
ncbi:type IV inositol polyphosphate 5-phosphatase 3-like [Phragmites australis]|uniref:type IV inositol polyphosphate 5-phosphatase 3-like n=1 Tax=Phragmites australis TaxID=29695 RepID=UPI002D78470E|nr:type IV inositol polyphosphate 5-phosphatase 3-like [Phragmites australis]